jgi:hypothetical protein
MIFKHVPPSQASNPKGSTEDTAKAPSFQPSASFQIDLRGEQIRPLTFGSRDLENVQISPNLPHNFVPSF